MSSSFAGSPDRDPEVPSRPGPAQPASGDAAGGWRTVAWATACGVLLAIVLVQLVADASRGLDLTDEGLVLLGAQNRQPGAAFNGFSGPSVGALFTLVGHDVAAFRIAGALLLAGAGGALGLAVARLLGAGSTRGTIHAALALATAAVSLGYYALYLRAPSYNWLALVGILLVGTGVLLALARPPGSNGRRRGTAGIGVVIGVGVAVALAGKLPTGIAAFMVAAAALGLDAGLHRQPRRLWPIAGAGAVAAVLVGLHLALVLGPGPSAELMRRSAAVLAIIDPAYYTPLHVLRNLVASVAGLPLLVVTVSFGVVLAGLLQLVPAVRRRLGRHTVAILGLGPVLVVGVTAPFVRDPDTGGWLFLGRYGLALVASAMIGLGATAVAQRNEGHHTPPPPADAGPPALAVGAGGTGDAVPARLAAVAGLAMLLLAIAYAIGSNNALAMQVGGAVGALAVAAAVFTGAMAALASGQSRDRYVRYGAPLPWAGAVLTVAAVVTVGAVWGGRGQPYRQPPMDSAVERASPARLHGLLFDAETATYWNELTAAAAANGWQPGDALLDLTWSPAVSWVLDARVPATLTTRVGREVTATASSVEAIRRSPDVDWTRAWLLISPDLEKTDTSEITASFGRPFPEGYERVGRFTIPFRGLRQELWRPRAP